LKLVGDVRRFNWTKPKRLRAARKEMRRTYPDAVEKLNAAQLGAAKITLRRMRWARYVSAAAMVVIAGALVALRCAVHR